MGVKRYKILETDNSLEIRFRVGKGEAFSTLAIFAKKYGKISHDAIKTILMLQKDGYTLIE